MKVFALTVVLLLLSGVGLTLSVKEIGRLSELKTGDELILQLLERDGIDQPLTAADVIYLREQGTSERVIQYLLVLSERPATVRSQTSQEESQRISENLRAYTTTTKDGKKIRVVTNLDESGNRMGPPVPPAPPESAEPQVYSPPPQQVHVTVTEQRERDRYEEDVPYPQPDYGGIPLYQGGYAPYYYPWNIHPFHLTPRVRHQTGRDMSTGWRFNASRPLVRPQAVSSPAHRAAARHASQPTRRK